MPKGLQRSTPQTKSGLQPPKRWRQRGVLLAALLLGFGLRLYQLGAESLWYDETVSVYLARLSAPELIAHTARDIHPPGYYLVLHGWGWLSTPSLSHGLEWLYGWPSLLFGSLLLPLLYQLGRRFFNERVGAMAALIAAVHPFHIWYSQEVRMYTLGALLGAICLYASLRWWQQQGVEKQGVRPGWRWLLLYAVSGAAGLYTLYYFAFLLISLNLILLITLAAARDWKRLWPWLSSQGIVLLLWLPWLPTFWRQITDPPVPPWRGSLDPLVIGQEILAALLVGQSPPGESLWLWSLLALAGLLAYFFYAKNRSRALILAGVIFLPMALILLISVSVTPLYHIRYFFPFGAFVPLLWATLLFNFSGRSLFQSMALAGLVSVMLASTLTFWRSPLYQSDDHRQAVADLARQWRPGDAILVNAGWGYPPLTLYWPDELTAPNAALPQQELTRVRLVDYAQSIEPQIGNDDYPVPLVIGGSVDGAESLGWGLAESDFYPISQRETEAALDSLAAIHPRIWHYRLYDTVSDPEGVIRGWLASETAQFFDQPYPGRDFLRVQGFASPATAEVCREQTILGDFGDLFSLTEWTLQPAEKLSGGQTAYVTLCLRTGETLADFGGTIRASLRFYTTVQTQAGSRRILAAQQDETIWPREPSPLDGDTIRVPLALPIPLSLPPGNYELALLLYRGEDGTPLAVEGPTVGGGTEAHTGGEQLILTPSLPITQSSTQPDLGGAFLAQFDYIQLMDATIQPQDGPNGPFVGLSLTWRPLPNEYRDDYRAIVSLKENGQDGAITTLDEWQIPLGGAFPSGGWAEGVPVRQWEAVPISLPPEAFADQAYQLTVTLERSADGQPLQASVGPWPWQQQPSVVLWEID